MRYEGHQCKKKGKKQNIVRKKGFNKKGNST